MLPGEFCAFLTPVNGVVMSFRLFVTCWTDIPFVKFCRGFPCAYWFAADVIFSPFFTV